jgi:hypothetical protein
MMPLDYSQLFGQSAGPQPVRRKVFISHYHTHQTETDQFLRDFGDVFVRKAVGALGEQNFINSSDPEYVMRRIRADYIGDSTVTIVLVGRCTHSRRYVDWEIKGSLRQAQDSLPNGLIGIQMPSSGGNFHAPHRLAANWNAENSECYARCYRYPQSKEELRGWIEDAYSARKGRAKWIKNSHDTMLGYNRTCQSCKLVH